MDTLYEDLNTFAQVSLKSVLCGVCLIIVVCQKLNCHVQKLSGLLLFELPLFYLQ